MSNLTEVSQFKLSTISAYYQGCLDGLLRHDSGTLEFSELIQTAFEMTQEYFYHYPIYQVELEYFLQKFNA